MSKEYENFKKKKKVPFTNSHPVQQSLTQIIGKLFSDQFSKLLTETIGEFLTHISNALQMIQQGQEMPSKFYPGQILHHLVIKTSSIIFFMKLKESANLKSLSIKDTKP
ncbi:hypothetical protein E2542_SST11702 [Spatholobus suberectus]|nr:hypothetical protein E2542_SST11702 [Spatholobus suberectus]